MKFNLEHLQFKVAVSNHEISVLRLVFEHQFYDDRFVVVKFLRIGDGFEPVNVKFWKGDPDKTMSRWPASERIVCLPVSLDQLFETSRSFLSDVVEHWFINETFV